MFCGMATALASLNEVITKMLVSVLCDFMYNDGV